MRIAVRHTRGDFNDSLGGYCCSSGPGDATNFAASAAADVHTRVDYTPIPNTTKLFKINATLRRKQYYIPYSFSKYYRVLRILLIHTPMILYMIFYIIYSFDIFTNVSTKSDQKKLLPRLSSSRTDSYYHRTR